MAASGAAAMGTSFFGAAAIQFAIKALYGDGSIDAAAIAAGIAAMCLVSTFACGAIFIFISGRDDRRQG